MATKEIEPVFSGGKIFKLVLLMVLIGAGFVVGLFMRPAAPQAETPIENQPVITPQAKIDLIQTAQKTGEGIVSQVVGKSKDIKQNVLGAMTQLVSNTASKSATVVSDFILDKTVPKVVKQIEKLPEPQRESIKKNILKTLSPEPK